ncbi:diguanylate cyclase [Corallincola platygyrae]|uniref:diguanylate cyclase n=1 Tax=Corallincola platygyrae TaxID=1193278 RepID=A0ABW4XIV6_9GAMM
MDLTRYLSAIQQLKLGDFTLTLPEREEGDPLNEFDQELLGLANWLERRFDEFGKLQAITEDISRGNLLGDVLDRIFDSFHSLIPYDRIGCALIDEDTQKVTAQWAKTNYPERVKICHGYSANLAGSSLENILKSKQPRIINDLKEHLKKHPKSSSTRLILAEGVLSSLTCPLIVEGKPIGFIFFSSKQVNTYKDVHQTIFLSIARQISVLIEKGRLYQHICDLNDQLVDAMQQLKDQSCRDALTGIFHRGAVMEFLQQRLSAAKRQKHPVSVVMADLDHFKQINDTYGHPAGDKVLKTVANEIQQQLRGCDSIGRYGGEEFLIVLDDTDAKTAQFVAERLRQKIESIEVQIESGTIHATTSMGIATVDFSKTDKSEDALLNEADKALYNAKRSGRNRVILSIDI